MGALEVLPSFFKNFSYPCAVNELNMALLILTVFMTVFIKRAFCSWVCPLGTISEFAYRIREKIVPFPSSSEAVIRSFSYLKYAALLVIIAATTYNYDLVFRPFCPYFTTFGLHGHTTGIFSYFILANVIILAFALKMGWCRVACPFGAFLNIFNARTVLALKRDPSGCNGCGICDRECPAGIQVSKSDKITSRECTMCVKCVSSCPRNGTINLEL